MANYLQQCLQTLGALWILANYAYNSNSRNCFLFEEAFDLHRKLVVQSSRSQVIVEISLYTLKFARVLAKFSQVCAVGQTSQDFRVVCNL